MSKHEPKQAFAPAASDDGGGRERVFAVRHGRGRTGGSTLLDLFTQLSRAAGRRVLVCDGDRRNPTLASLYPPGTPGGATQPALLHGSAVEPGGAIE